MLRVRSAVIVVVIGGIVRHGPCMVTIAAARLSFHPSHPPSALAPHFNHRPLATYELDQAAGVMIPFYDEDTRMLYLTGKVRSRAELKRMCARPPDSWYGGDGR